MELKNPDIKHEIDADIEDVIKFLLRDDVRAYINLKRLNSLSFEEFILQKEHTIKTLEFELTAEVNKRREIIFKLLPLADANPVVQQFMLEVFGSDFINAHKEFRKNKKNKKTKNTHAHPAFRSNQSYHNAIDQKMKVAHALHNKPSIKGR